MKTENCNGVFVNWFGLVRCVARWYAWTDAVWFRFDSVEFNKTRTHMHTSSTVLDATPDNQRQLKSTQYSGWATASRRVVVKLHWNFSFGSFATTNGCCCCCLFFAAFHSIRITHREPSTIGGNSLLCEWLQINHPSNGMKHSIQRQIHPDAHSVQHVLLCVFVYTGSYTKKSSSSSTIIIEFSVLAVA